MDQIQFSLSGSPYPRTGKGLTGPQRPEQTSFLPGWGSKTGNCSRWMDTAKENKENSHQGGPVKPVAFSS